MPLIKPRTRGKQLVKHRTRLDCENNETLYAYAQFLSESTEYVLNQVIDTVLARDKEFIKWRESHQGSYVPRTKDRQVFMLRKIVEARALVALAMSGGVGLWGLRAYPVSHDDVFLGLIGERAPGVLSVLTYGYATLWFTTP